MKEQLRQYFTRIENPVQLQMYTGQHESRDELKQMLSAVAELSDKIELTEKTDDGASPIAFDVISEGKPTGIRFKDRTTGEEIDLPLDGIFVQIGLIPNTAFVDGLVERNRFGEIVVDTHGRTSVPGIFAAGDATTTPYKQIAIALGDGAKASLAAFEYLLKQPKVVVVA